MLVPSDGEDGGGLQLEKVGPTFSMCSIVDIKVVVTMCLEISLKLVCSSFENSIDIFLLVL